MDAIGSVLNGMARSNARFDILVLNHQRVNLFFENFHKLECFDATRDRVIVLDCSQDPERERRIVEDFARRRGWTVGGDELAFISRPNWGIDQGGRVDYLSALLGAQSAAPYVWQFQEHYLDNTSDYSRWTSGPSAQRVKEDVIPDGGIIDLDLCERAFSDSDVTVAFAARPGVGVFAHPDGRNWFYAEGANFAFRTSAVRSAFSLELLDDYRLVFDASYRWALFMEFEFGRRLSGGSWFDMIRGRAFRDAEDVHASERASHACLSAKSRPNDYQVIDRYDRRLGRVRALPPTVRQALLATVFPAVGAFQSRVFLPARAKLLARNIDSPRWLRSIW
jgi:hypothetical protein